MSCIPKKKGKASRNQRPFVLSGGRSFASSKSASIKHAIADTGSSTTDKTDVLASTVSAILAATQQTNRTEDINRLYIANRTPVFDADRNTKSYDTINVNESSTAVIGDVIHQQHYHFHISGTTCEEVCPNHYHRHIEPFDRPSSYFETLPSYRPDKYACRAEDLDTCAYFHQELLLSGSLRFELLSILCSTTSGERIRLHILLIISPKSKLWYLTRCPSPDHSYSTKLPSRVLATIRDSVKGADSAVQDDLFMIKSNRGTNPKHCEKGPSLDVAFSQTCLLLSRTLQDLTQTLPHWQCPWFQEDTLDYRPLFWNRQSYHSLVFG